MGLQVSYDSGGRLFVVVGMQFGSEGKGAITSYLAPIMGMGVRTGAANAGHTMYHCGKRYVMRQIPSVWTNPLAELVIGVGAMISLPILLAEISAIEKVLPIRHRLSIDPRAHVITDEQIARESEDDLGARIGSTSARAREGIGVASADKVLRSADVVRAGDVPSLRPYCSDTVERVNERLDRGDCVLLEGAQGFSLSIEHGAFPFVTSRDTSAIGLAASVGVATHAFPTSVIGVTRTYPIRVSGNSGPFDPDSTEMSWKEVARRAGAPSLVEYTTVTGAVRRVATFSREGFVRACRVNRPTEIALTFADYLDWKSHEQGDISLPIEEFMEMVETLAGAPVTLVKTGPHTIIDLDEYRRIILRKLA